MIPLSLSSGALSMFSKSVAVLPANPGSVSAIASSTKFGGSMPKIFPLKERILTK